MKKRIGVTLVIAIVTTIAVLAKKLYETHCKLESLKGSIRVFLGENGIYKVRRSFEEFTTEEKCLDDRFSKLNTSIAIVESGYDFLEWIVNEK